MARLGRRLRSNSIAIRNLPQVVSVLKGVLRKRGTLSGGSRAAQRIVGIGNDERILLKVARTYLSRLEREFCLPEPECWGCPVRYWCSTGQRRMQPDVRVANGPKSVGFLDLFCGPGGMSLGLERAGMKLVLGVDSDHDAIDSFRANRPRLDESVLVEGNVSQMVCQGFFRKFRGVDLVVGGPPCQTFSIVGLRTKGLRHAQRQIRRDPRTWLPLAFARAAIQAEPRVVLMENVPHFLSALNGEVARGFSSLFRRHGYSMMRFVVQADHFGVAQYRRRLLFLAIEGSHVGSPAKARRILQSVMTDLSSVQRPKRGFSEAVAGLPRLRPGAGFECLRTEGRGLVWNHVARPHNRRDLAIYRAMKPGETAGQFEARKPGVVPYDITSF